MFINCVSYEASKRSDFYYTKVISMMGVSTELAGHRGTKNNRNAIIGSQRSYTCYRR